MREIIIYRPKLWFNYYIFFADRAPNIPIVEKFQAKKKTLKVMPPILILLKAN